MESNVNPVSVLEELRDLISSSIEVVRQDALKNHDPPLSLWNPEPHPIHNRYNSALTSSLKCISAAAQMLRDICDPNAYLNDIIYGHHDQTALFVACQADIANIIGTTDCTSKQLAMKTGINREKLARYLRHLCNCLIFREAGENRFANNALSTGFQVATKKALVGHCADEGRTSSSKVWKSLTLADYKDSNEANMAPFNIAYNTPLTVFEYLKQVRPDIGQRAQAAMAGKAINLGQYLSLYPWASEGSATIVDVGGGVGGATLPILKEYPMLHLKIQDLPETEEAFLRNLGQNYSDIQLQNRIEFQCHNFFDPQPEKEADIYFLRHVIHDWPDPDAVKILSNCAAVMSKKSKLLIHEHVIFPTYRSEREMDRNDKVSTEDDCVGARGYDESPEPLLANWGQPGTSRLDLQVLAFLNAKQRTQAQFRDLVSQAGLIVVRIWRNGSDEALIECARMI